MNMTVLTALLAFVLTATTPVHAATKPRTRTIRSLQVLAVIYRGPVGSKDRLDDAAVEGIRRGIAYGRLFYFRNTFARLNLNITYKLVDAVMPDNKGPTYKHIEQNLRDMGVKDNQYDAVYATGVGATGNWGGFRILGRTGASFGVARKGKVLYQVPQDDPKTWYYVAWIFTHEFQHALDLVLATESGRPDLLHAHPYADRHDNHFHWGHHGAQNWDWIAYTLRTFGYWMSVTGATNSTLTFTDQDWDGLPDDDARLPMDERRFGSDPTKTDTDHDGLNDLDEFTADLYRGADPCKTDSDHDGVSDGRDPYPTVAIRPTLAFVLDGPTVDGQPDACYRPLFLSPYLTNLPSFKHARIDAAWNKGGLYLFIHEAKPASLYIQIDGSPKNGFWEGGDTYGVHVSADGKIRGEWGDKDVSKARAAWGGQGLEVFIPAQMGQGLSGEVNYGGKRRPEDAATGMTLIPNERIALNVALSTDSGKVLFTPNWSMFDVTLLGATRKEPQMNANERK